jgi:4-alpha-glucanotransferase
MTAPLYLLLGIHHHQPVGNFDHIFEDAFRRCYRPLLDAIERHPRVKISLHHSGPLLDWAAKREDGYLERVAALVESGQVEIMGGGFYEPILPTLRPADALGQIEMMQKFWEKRTGQRPAGMWLAERVWEPSIAALMSDAGMRYTILDDQHFRHAGITDETLFDYYLTERAGKSMSIFPSDKHLRYFIPFREAHVVVDHLLSLQHRFPGRAVTYGDDGEKFGVWPGTYKWVIEEGWLEKFLSALEHNSERIKTVTFPEFMKIRPPAGSVYLPTASYSEMLEWAMPADAILRYEDAKESMERAGVWDKAAAFFRGGFWDNFFTKYPESNLMHKRAVFVSKKIEAAEAKGKKIPDARAALYRSQCNCAYWHGLFGGIYLNYLRHALYSNMIDAELLTDRAIEGKGKFTKLEITDFDCCGSNEAILANENLSCIVKPSAGGGIVALDLREKRFNIINTFARRKEAYHVSAHHESGKSSDGVPSIHDIGKDIRELAKHIVYDSAPRYAFIDHAFTAEPNWEKLADDQSLQTGSLHSLRYEISAHSRKSGSTAVTMSGKAHLSGGADLAIAKTISLDSGNNVTVHYRIDKHGDGPAPAWFATAFNFTLLAGHDEGRYFQWGEVKPATVFMDERRVLANVHEIAAKDRAFGFEIRLLAKCERMVLAPVETVSQSEKGFDKLYQGSAIWLGFKPSWDKNDSAEFSVDIEIKTEA